MELPQPHSNAVVTAIDLYFPNKLEDAEKQRRKSSKTSQDNDENATIA